MGFWMNLRTWNISTHLTILLQLPTISFQVKSYVILIISMPSLSNTDVVYTFTIYSITLLAETQVKKEVSELDGEPYGLMTFSTESFSPSGSMGLSEWSKETAVPHAESSGNVKDGFATTNSNEMHWSSYESEDDRKPLSTLLLGSWVGRGRSRNKNLLNTRCTR